MVTHTRNLCSAINPSKVHTHREHTHTPWTHTHTPWTHTHCEHTHTHREHTHTPWTHTHTPWTHTHTPWTHTHREHTHTVNTHPEQCVFRYKGDCTEMNQWIIFGTDSLQWIRLLNSSYEQGEAHFTQAFYIMCVVKCDINSDVEFLLATHCKNGIFPVLKTAKLLSHQEKYTLTQ